MEMNISTTGFGSTGFATLVCSHGRIVCYSCEQFKQDARERQARIDETARMILAAGTGKHGLPGRRDWDISCDVIYALALESARTRSIDRAKGEAK